MSALVWRDDNGRLRCRRSPGGVDWYVRQPRAGGFDLWEAVAKESAGAEGAAPPSGEGPGLSGTRVAVGRIDPETAERIIRFLLREEGSRG